MSNFFRKPIFDTPAWGLLIPLAALAILFIFVGAQLSSFGLLLVVVALLAAVLVAVHHAEVIALRVGEPFGTLVLALAVTIPITGWAQRVLGSKRLWIAALALFLVGSVLSSLAWRRR